MDISVVILNYNVKYFLAQCIVSVQEALQNITSEIIVVDNASTDGSKTYIEALFPDIAFIANTDNLGFSKGNNIGVAKAKGQYICILNPDMVVPEDSFKKLLTFIKNTPNCGAIGTRLLDGRGMYLPESKRNIPTPLVTAFKILGLQKHLGTSKTAYYTDTLLDTQTGKTSVLVGAFMFMSKAIYQQVGGFDPDYFMYGEDIDLSYKIEKAGYHNYHLASVSCIHYKGESTLKDKVYARRFYRAMYLFYKKHFNRYIIGGYVFKILYRILSKIHVPGAKVADLVTTDAVKNVCIYTQLEQRYQDIAGFMEQKQCVFVANRQELDSYLTTYNSSFVEIVFDNECFTFLEIISTMEKIKNKNITYKIIPRNCNFMLGSNHSDARGEILFLNKQ